MDTTTGYWLCSAVAQSFAALTALTGLYAVYKLQTIREAKEGTRTRFFYELKRARDEVNRLQGGFAGRFLTRIQNEPVPIRGEHGWAEAVSSYGSEYASNLDGIVLNFGDSDEKRWAQEMQRFFDGSKKEYESKTEQHRICRRWAVAMTVTDGLVTFASLAMILLVPSLGSALSLIMVSTVVLAGLALALTLVACVTILTTGEADPA